MAGKFIVVEGIEGAGKSTHINFIANYFSKQNKKVVITREPGGTKLGEDLRKILLHNNSTILPISELLLMFAARHQHIKEKIIPALQNNNIVISDRFVESSYAYQGGGRQLDKKIIQTIEKITLNDFKPDLTLLLDIPLKVAFERLQERHSADRFEKESLDFWQKTYDVYQQIINNNAHIKKIDTTGSIEQTQQQIIALIAKL